MAPPGGAAVDGAPHGAAKGPVVADSPPLPGEFVDDAEAAPALLVIRYDLGWSRLPGCTARIHDLYVEEIRRPGEREHRQVVEVFPAGVNNGIRDQLGSRQSDVLVLWMLGADPRTHMSACL
jgi:hypothetical protein